MADGGGTVPGRVPPRRGPCAAGRDCGLAAAAGKEIEACGLAAAGRWAEASRAAQDAARQLGKGGEATRGYRALWLYLAGTWADQAGDDKGDPACAGLPEPWSGKLRRR